MYELFTAYMRLLFYFFTAREQVVKARNFCTPPYQRWHLYVFSWETDVVKYINSRAQE